MIKPFTWKLKGIAMLVAAGALGATLSAHADSMFYDIDYAKAETGAQIQIGETGPWIRIAMQIKALDGKFETKDILISSEGFLQAMQTTGINVTQAAEQVAKVGDVELLFKDAHVGLAFKGVQVGQDPDRGLSYLLRAGLGLLANIYRSSQDEGMGGDDLRLDWHTNYDWDEFTSVTGIKASRSMIENAIALHMQSASFSAIAEAYISQEADSNFTHFFDFSRMDVGVSAQGGVRHLVKFDDFALGVSGKLSVDRDGYLNQVLGINATAAVGSVLFDFAWVGDDHN